MAGAGVDRARARVLDRLGGRAQRAGGVDHVVDDDGVASLDVADDVHDLADVGRRPALVDDRQAGAEALRVGARALDAAGVGRDDDRLLREALRRSSIRTGMRVQMIDRDVEEALDLAGVQVDRQHAVGAGGGEQVGDQLRAEIGVRGLLLRSWRA